jgi:hypothetical protein
VTENSFIYSFILIRLISHSYPQAGHSRRERYQFASPLGLFRVGEVLNHVLLFRMTKSLLMLKATRDGVDYKASLGMSRDSSLFCFYSLFILYFFLFLLFNCISLF